MLYHVESILWANLEQERLRHLHPGELFHIDPFCRGSKSGSQRICIERNRTVNQRKDITTENSHSLLTLYNANRNGLYLRKYFHFQRVLTFQKISFASHNIALYTIKSHLCPGLHVILDAHWLNKSVSVEELSADSCPVKIWCS